MKKALVSFIIVAFTLVACNNENDDPNWLVKTEKAERKAQLSAALDSLEANIKRQDSLMKRFDSLHQILLESGDTAYAESLWVK